MARCLHPYLHPPPLRYFRTQTKTYIIEVTLVTAQQQYTYIYIYMYTYLLYKKTTHDPLLSLND